MCKDLNRLDIMLLCYMQFVLIQLCWPSICLVVVLTLPVLRRLAQQIRCEIQPALCFSRFVPAWRLAWFFILEVSVFLVSCCDWVAFGWFGEVYLGI